MCIERYILASKDTVATWSCDVIKQVFLAPLGKNDQESHQNWAESKLSLLGIKIKKKKKKQKQKDVAVKIMIY